MQQEIKEMAADIIKTVARSMGKMGYEVKINREKSWVTIYKGRDIENGLFLQSKNAKFFIYILDDTSKKLKLNERTVSLACASIFVN